jgi:hypothetical protein
MTQRGPFLFLVALLALAGIAGALYRYYTYGVPFLPGQQQTVWHVEARIEFVGQNAPAQVILTLPPTQSGFRIVDERAASSGFGFMLEELRDQRRAHWSKREVSGNQLMFYELELVADDALQPPISPPLTPQPIHWDDPYETAAQDLLSRVLPVSADAYTLARQLILEMNTLPRDQSVALLRNRYALPGLFADLLAQAGIPARRVQGLVLEDGRRRQPLLELVQVWTGQSWQLFDPASGPVGDASNLLLWQTTSPSVLEVIGGTRSRVTFSVLSHTRPSLELSQERIAAATPALSLYSLPIEEQALFKLVLLLPVGAFVVVFMRILVGVQTSGTFMPVLIAMALLQTELLPGLALLLVIVTLGLLIRSYLSSLNLLLVARIATLVLVVIGIVSVMSVVGYRLGLMQGLTITFFPMVILAWTVERMSIVWEEDGPYEVLVQGTGSLFVAVVAYLLMDQNLTRHLVFNFPELHLVVLAVILLIGRYTGYRLSELRRFAPISERAA